MSFRVKFSIFLIVIAIMLALLPSAQQSVFELKPTDLLEKSLDESCFVTPDKVAQYIVREDSTIQLIDLRSEEEYKAFNLPGSINIPYKDLLNKDWKGYLNQKEKKNIFYSNGDILSTNAWSLTTRLGYTNNYVMAGGMNNWYKTVMESRFKGTRITPKENALFENRYKARKLFTQLNSLPDSLKVTFLKAKRLKEEELDGGCN